MLNDSDRTNELGEALGACTISEGVASSCPCHSIDSCTALLAKYKIGTVLSQSRRGFLCKATNKSNGELVCCKVAFAAVKGDASNGNTNPELERICLRSEYAGLVKCAHECVHRTYELIEEDFYTAMISELMDCDLYQLGEECPILPTESIIYITKKVVEAIHHLHETLGVCHLDIKPENIFLKRPENHCPEGRPWTLQDISNPEYMDDFRVVIADMSFWTRCRRENGDVRLLLGLCGSPGYVAPEIQGNTEGFDGALADIWSLGRTLFFLAIGFPPWERSEKSDPFYRVWTSGNYKGYWSAIDVHCQTWEIPDSFKHLITHMLKVHPSERMTIGEVLRHPFFSNDESFRWAPA